MLITATVSVVAGVAAGVALACIIFIANMSKPVIRRHLSGESTFSKRIRPERDTKVLRETGARRAIFELQGVLFFGNAEDLARAVTVKSSSATVVVLDLRGISDIDVSGVTVLRGLVERLLKRSIRVVFCNVPPGHSSAIRPFAGNNLQSIFPDLDSALEVLEEEALVGEHGVAQSPEQLALSEHEFVRGLVSDELAAFAPYLIRREFKQGSNLCVEGEPADRMWLLMKGSVSVRLRVQDVRGTRRIASLAFGTVVGDLAFIEESTRSAMVVADDDIICEELQRVAFERCVREQPHIANKLLMNLGKELAGRVRKTSEELRQTAS